VERTLARAAGTRVEREKGRAKWYPRGDSCQRDTGDFLPRAKFLVGIVEIRHCFRGNDRRCVINQIQGTEFHIQAGQAKEILLQMLLLTYN